MKIAFLGAGTMGRPMLANLVKKGHTVRRLRSCPRPRWTAPSGPGSTRRLGGGRRPHGEIVITMLPSSSHVVSAFLGDGGVLDGVARGQLCIDMSTIDPSISRRVAEAR